MGFKVCNNVNNNRTVAYKTFFTARFMIYVKLSVLMGLNWVMEVVSSFQPDLKIWWFTDAYNLLIGVLIFLLFVCKRKIINSLIKKYVYIISIITNIFIQSIIEQKPSLFPRSTILSFLQLSSYCQAKEKGTN